MTMCPFSIFETHLPWLSTSMFELRLNVSVKERASLSKVRLLRPLPEANLATDVEMLVRACIDHLHVTSLDLSVSHPPMQALHWK